MSQTIGIDVCHYTDKEHSDYEWTYYLCNGSFEEAMGNVAKLYDPEDIKRIEFYRRVEVYLP